MAYEQQVNDFFSNKQQAVNTTSQYQGAVNSFFGSSAKPTSQPTKTTFTKRRLPQVTYKPTISTRPKLDLYPSKVSSATPKPKKQAEASVAKKVAKGVGKFAISTAVNFADLITESVDFTSSFMINNPIFNPGQALSQKTTELIHGKESKKAKEQKAELNKWQDFYKGLAEKPKLAVDRIQAQDYLQPSEKWVKAPLKDKLTKQLGETLAILGPSIIPSFALYAINPALGLTTIITSTANDIKSGAIENGVSTKNAERLGLGAGILVGALDRIVPDELFSPAQKSKFLSGFIKRIVPISLKEAGTEVAQENIQLVAEKTFREDLGWDEVMTRSVLSGLGGLLGGAGMTTIVGTVNNALRQDILLEEKEAIEPKPAPKEKPKPAITKPEVTKKVTEEVTKAPLVAEAGKRGYDSKNPLANIENVKRELNSEITKAHQTMHDMLFKYVDKKVALKDKTTSPLEMMTSKDRKIYNDAQKTFDNAMKLLKSESKPDVAKATTPPVSPTAKKLVGESGGEGKTPSKIAKSIEQKAIEQKLTEGFEDVAGYDKITIKDQARRAAEQIKDIEQTRRIIRGEEELPSGLKGLSLVTAVEDYISKTGDVDIAYELANSTLVSETSEAAQVLRLARERQQDSLTMKLAALKKAKEDAFKKTHKGKTVKQATDKRANDITAKVKKVSKYDWNNFINSIDTC